MASIREKLKANIDAIEIALKLSNGKATPTQLQILQQYDGFGDLKCILLDPHKPEQFAKSEQDLVPFVQRLHDVIRENAPNQYDNYFSSLRGSVLTSFYTPVEIIKAIDTAFFENRYFFSNMLDPSAGNGAFTNIRANKYTLVENDILTSKILTAINPEKKVISTGFESVPARINNSFNLVASNIPFGDFKVFDASYLNSKNIDLISSTNAIHTYFFEKGLDALKNGGVLAFIAPTGIMDARKHEQFRKHILSRAHLVSAVRLPENTFDSTKAQSDLIILQKNNNRSFDTPLSKTENSFLRSVQIDTGVYINELYAANNDRVMATRRGIGTNMYGQPDVRFYNDYGIEGITNNIQQVVPLDIKNEIDRKLFMSNNQTEKIETDKPVQLSLFDDANFFLSEEEIKPISFDFENPIYDVVGCFQLQEDKIGISNGEGTADLYDAKEEDVRQLIIDYVHLRDAYYALKDYENEHLKENNFLRTELNRSYDIFINSPYSNRFPPRQINLDIVSDKFILEPSYTELKGLEIIRDGKISKSDIFFEPVAFGRDKEIYTPQEALHLCRNRYNNVNLDYLQSITKMSEDEIISELKGQIYKNPQTYLYETADIFLSGNVVEKYETAQRAFAKNSVDYEIKDAMDALKSTIPAKIPFHDIGLNLGERWIPVSYYSDFATYLFNTESIVSYNGIIDHFDIDAGYSHSAHQKFSVRSANRHYTYEDVLRFALLDTIPEMTKTVGYGSERKTVPDSEGIAKMNAAILSIQNEWKIWSQNLPANHKFNIEEIYNRTFNCFVRPSFNGSFQTFPGLDLSAIKYKDLYQTQKDAILRIKCQNGGIIDHEVGGGKTAIFCVSAYEMKRLGICHKPLIIGMKANTIEIAETFKKMYPEANLLYASEKEFNAKNREIFLNKIQNNNWDCIIMTHEQFKAIPQSDETKKIVLNEELNKIREALFALRNGDYSFKRAEKELEKAMKNRTVELNEVTYRLSMQRDTVVDFKNMGIDHIFCDESHKFKNTSIKTKHVRVAGIGNTQGSDRSMNLKLAIRTIQERNKSDLGATFISGTTIVNSLTELYALFDYLRPRALEKQGIMSFDAWASVYTKKSKEIEFGITNELQLKERFREFVKVPELSIFYGQITDYKTADNIGLDRPKRNEILIALEKTEEQVDMYDRLKKFAKSGEGQLIFRENLSANEITAKMLIATNTARKAALDLRLIDEERYMPEASNRTQAVSDRAYDYYTKYNAHKGTQLIFSDIGVDKGEERFSIYGDIKRKLMDKGIPDNEIQFVQDFNTDRQRQKLFEQMNDGDVRILIGSTEKLGTGVNAQERCVAIHHVNIPWTPKDFEQRNGRAIRTGNRVAKFYADNKVDVLIYATKETLDTYQFNLVQNKAHFIAQIKDQSISVRKLDEGGMDESSGMSYADYIAVLSGNTELLEKAKLEREIMQYKTEERIFLDKARDRDMQIVRCSEDKQKMIHYLELFKKDMQLYKSIPMNAKGFPVDGAKVGEVVYKDAKSFGDAINKVLDKNNTNTVDYVEIGSFANFQLVMIGEKMLTENKQEIFHNRLFVQGNLKYQHNKGSVPRTAEFAGKYPIAALNRIEGCLIPQYIKNIEELNTKISAYQTVEYTFPNKEKLELAEARLSDIKASLEKKYGAGRYEIESSLAQQNNKGLKFSMMFVLFLMNIV